MKSQTKALIVGSMTAFVGILSPATVLATDGGHDKDLKDHKDSTCYAVTEGEVDATTTADDRPPFIVRYLTENEGRLISEEEARKFGHLKQQAYSVVGKAAALFHENGDQCVDATCPENIPEGDREQNRIMATVDGTIITGKEHHNGNNESNNGSPDEPGAHMGLDVQFLRFDNGNLAIGPITFECTSPDVDKTPDRWLCNVKAEVQEPGFSLLVTALTPPITLNKVVNPLEVPACSVFQDSGGALPISGDIIVTTPPGAPVAPPIGCGDGTVTPPEQCDDSNTTDGDGCSSICTVEVPPTTPIGCGDGTVTPPEQCDDSNTTDGDGCSSICTVEVPPTTPIGCGDGTVTPPEQCDDSNTTDGDGCSSICTVEVPPATNRLR